MKPHEEHSNGDRRGGVSAGLGGSSGSGSGSEGEEELSLEDAEAPARALHALNALRKSRQHYDVVLQAGGGEVVAHRAVLAAHSPYLLRALQEAGGGSYRVPGVEADALRALVDYLYTGRLRVAGAGAARRLYRAAWRLRVETARAHLADTLARARSPHDALRARALPDLPARVREQIDQYIADNFDDVVSGGWLAALPLVRIELVRASSAAGGGEAADAVARAALEWLAGARGAAPLTELCARPHLLFVDARGSLRDCSALPPAASDAPELQEYRRAAAERAARPAPPAAPLPATLPGLELGAREAARDCAVLAARCEGGGEAGGVTRALLVLGGALAAACVSWRDVSAPEMEVGGALGGGAGERRALLPGGGRCAGGTATLGGRLVACGGYDRARVLTQAVAYDAGDNAWHDLPPLRRARARFPALALRGRLYVVGGSDGHSELDSVDVLEDGGWRGAARLPLPLAYCGGAGDEEGGAVYAVGGWAGGRPRRQVLRYEPGDDAWVDAPPLNTARSQCAAVCWRGSLWALGGCDAWHCVSSTERLVRGGAEWEVGPPLPTARRSVGGCVWGGRLVAAGGSDGAASLRSVDWLEHEEGAWRAGPALRRARAGLGLDVLRGVLYAVGGFDGKEFLSCVECLHAPDGEWTSLVSPPALCRAARALAEQRDYDTRDDRDRQQESKQNGEHAPAQ